MHLFSSEVIPPTCISQGYTKYTCECGEVAKSEFVQPLGHDFADWIITQEPTNSSAGSKERTCKLCGELEIEEIPHTHTYIETIVEVTCTTNGYTEYVCLCGDNYKDNYVNALDHDYSDFVITREPTETSGGKKEKTCKRCNYKIVLDIPKLDHEHNYEIKNIELTCETDGCTLYTCYCGYSYQENIVKATGHNYTDWKIIKEATEYNSGLKEKTCVTCNNKVTEEIQRLDHEHKYTKNIVSPTCTSQGYTEYICLCNEKYTDTYTAPTGHNLEVEVLKKANYVEEGEIKKYCINCSHIEIEQTSAYNCNHEFNMSKQYSNSSLTPGLNITNCKYCCNQKMELVEAISPITQTTMPLKEYSQKSIKKSIIKAKNIFKEVENKNEKELFNIPYMSLKEFKEVREFTLNLIKDCTSDKQKTRVIYEWIIDNLVYDMNAYTYTVYDTFKTKKAVCFGYTSLLHDMLSAAGIMSSYVSGYTNYDNLKYTDIYH